MEEKKGGEKKLKRKWENEKGQTITFQRIEPLTLKKHSKTHSMHDVGA